MPPRPSPSIPAHLPYETQAHTQLTMTDPLSRGDTLIHVPSTALLTVTPSDCFLRDVSVHHALAESLVDRAAELKPWLDVMPSYEDLENCMPVLWNAKLARRLPYAARGMYNVRRGTGKQPHARTSPLFSGTRKLILDFDIFVYVMKPT